MNDMKRILKKSLALIAMAAVVVALFIPVVMKAGDNSVQYKKLTPEEKHVILDKGTEMPYTGKYYNFNEDGTYTCKRCGAVLFRSNDKFDAGCGWPSFDDAVPGAIKFTPDPDGMRTEITCANCGAHLGHVFKGEHFTDKNTRYCVNSISLDFVKEGDPMPAEVGSDMLAEKAVMASAQMPAEPGQAGMDKSDAMMDTKSDAMKGDKSMATMDAKPKTEKGYFAGGCFWGVEYYMEQIPGVIDARNGYMGGHIDNPTYQEVCSDTTGYAETVEVEFDPSKTDYETVAKTFFEIHDPTQMDRQGPDVGDQYRSEVFYANAQQKQIAEKLIGILKDKGYKVVTKVAPAGKFWPAEAYHQNYYDRHGTTPYCHAYTKRF